MSQSVRRFSDIVNDSDREQDRPSSPSKTKVEVTRAQGEMS